MVETILESNCGHFIIGIYDFKVLETVEHLGTMKAVLSVAGGLTGVGVFQ